MAILEEYTIENPAHARLKTPTFLSTVMGAAAGSAVAIISPLPIFSFKIGQNTKQIPALNAKCLQTAY
jgi:hypothetical protein